MRKLLPLLITLFLVGAASGVPAGPAAAAAQDLFLVGGRIVDPEAREIRAENLLIRDGVIVGTPSAAPPDFEGETLDVSGRWVMPGLVDLHTHSFGNQTPVRGAGEFLGTPVVAGRMLFAGVTAFLDLFGLEDQLFTIRDAQRERPTPSADLFVSGSCLTAPEGHCTEYGVPTRVMSTPDEAREQVAELAERGPDVVKIVYSPGGRMPSIDRGTLTAAVHEAKRLGIPTVVHIDTWEDVRHAALAGASAVTHVPGGGPIPDDVLALMVDRGVVSIPTLAVELGLADLSANPELLDGPLAGGVTTDAVRAAYRSDGGWSQTALGWRDRQREARARILENVRRMHEAGVPVLVGTDAGNLGTIQGWSVHHELMKLVEAGLDPWDALAAGTTRAAAFLDLDYGVTPGASAHLVILEASPIDDIQNTRRIADVIHRGERMNRDALAAS